MADCRFDSRRQLNRYVASPFHESDDLNRLCDLPRAALFIVHAVAGDFVLL